MLCTIGICRQIVELWMHINPTSVSTIDAYRGFGLSSLGARDCNFQLEY